MKHYDLRMSYTAIPLRISRSSAGLVVSGEVDSSTVATLASFLTPLPGESREVKVDMSEVAFMDSSGLRALIDAHREAEQSLRRLMITNPSSVVLRLIDLSGLQDVLHVSQEG